MPPILSVSALAAQAGYRDNAPAGGMIYRATSKWAPRYLLKVNVTIPVCARILAQTAADLSFDGVVDRVRQAEVAHHATTTS